MARPNERDPSPPDVLWDPAAQAERTRLSWQRTALSGLAASLVVGKLVSRHSVLLGVVLTGVAILITGAMLLLSRARYRRANAALFADARLPDARLAVATLGLILVTGVGAASYTVLELILFRTRN